MPSTRSLPTLPFAKGHGTGNDFVLLLDLDDALDLDDDVVRALCDRRTGVGADGVLRAVRTPEGGIFMDYRNADGSLAEMCGNGIRVFVRYLVQRGVVPAGAMTVDTRAGALAVTCPEVGDVSVVLGTGMPPLARARVLVTAEGVTRPAVGVLVPNPHAVVFVDDLADAGPLTKVPEVTPPAVFPDGVNVEFVVDRGPDHVAMRVFERGVGETMSCGTGACAVAWAVRRREGAPRPGPIRVDVPGGSLVVDEDADGTMTLTGPAVIVAEGEMTRDWLRAVEGRSRE